MRERAREANEGLSLEGQRGGQAECGPGAPSSVGRAASPLRPVSRAAAWAPRCVRTRNTAGSGGWRRGGGGAASRDAGRRRRLGAGRVDPDSRRLAGWGAGQTVMSCSVPSLPAPHLPGSTSSRGPAPRLPSSTSRPVLVFLGPFTAWDGSSAPSLFPACDGRPPTPLGWTPAPRPRPVPSCVCEHTRAPMPRSRPQGLQGGVTARETCASRPSGTSSISPQRLPDVLNRDPIWLPPQCLVWKSPCPRSLCW